MGIVTRVARQFEKEGLSGVVAAIARRLARPFRVAFDLLFVIATSDFFRPSTGRHYRVGLWTKLGVAVRFALNSQRVRTASHWKEHLVMATDILNTSPELKGVVVECGSFCGFSTANLSIVCKLCGRKLYVCDSFQGLPEPKADEGLTIIPHRSEHYDFHEGQYSASLETVKANVERFGEIEVCEFVEGYFEQTLARIDEEIILVFEDADLRSSVETCIKSLWPKLQPGCCFYCHEPWSSQIVELFYSHELWRDELDCEPPGFHGSGFGVPLGMAKGSGIGFAKKIAMEDYLESSKLRTGM